MSDSIEINPENILRRLKAAGHEGLLPSHVAVIMDGNGRWAKKKHRPRIFGHREGMKSVRAVVKAAAEIGVSYLTLYAFSTENWSRPEDEIQGLFKLLRYFCEKEIDTFIKNDLRVQFVGRRSDLSENIIDTIELAEKRTEHCRKMVVSVALNYGGQQEIIDACKRMLTDSELQADPERLDVHSFYSYLYDPNLPPVDLLIRTSGEYRISNFLIYQSAYAEFIFTDILWPDFRKNEFYVALSQYLDRDRRFGGVNLSYE